MKKGGVLLLFLFGIFFVSASCLLLPLFLFLLFCACLAFLCLCCFSCFCFVVNLLFFPAFLLLVFNVLLFRFYFCSVLISFRSRFPSMVFVAVAFDQVSLSVLIMLCLLFFLLCVLFLLLVLCITGDAKIGTTRFT